MIDPIFSTAISAALFASATIPVILSRRARRREECFKAKPKNMVNENVVKALIKYGKAYAVDMGDYTMVVVVLGNEAQEEKVSLDNNAVMPIAVKIEEGVEAVA